MAIQLVGRLLNMHILVHFLLWFTIGYTLTVITLMVRDIIEINQIKRQLIEYLDLENEKLRNTILLDD